jgi:ABC-type multidrug transport system fused ATPase/permease subunit
MSWLSTTLRKNPYFSLLATAWHYAREERRRYALTYSLFTVSNLVVSLVPILWGWFINKLQLEGAATLRSLWLYVGAYFGIHLLNWACHYPARLMERDLAFRLSRNMLDELYHKIVHLPVGWHQNHHSGNTINRVRKAYEALRNFFDFGFAYFQTLTKMIFALAALVYFSPLFGGLALCCGVGVVAIILYFDKPFIAASTETNEREHEVSSTLFDSLSNIITVITLRLESRMQLGLTNRIDAVYPPFIRQTRINENKWFAVTTAITLIYVVIVLGYVYQNYRPGEVFLVGGLVTLVGYVMQFTQVFQGFAMYYTQIVRYHTDVQSAEVILRAYAQQHRPESDHSLPEHWQTIDLRQLNFRYRNADGSPTETGLHDLSLRIRRGERIALVGESGSGKSSLLALLRGLYAPESVTLRVDGRPEPDLTAINDRVTLMPQEPEIFENTIRYNITLGLPFPPEVVAQAIDLAAFAEVAELLPEGLESSIKEKGVNLSGGQKQRLALARGILAGRSSDILLLDEPTSSVDPKTELTIYQRMFAALGDKSVVSSLHRLHLLRLFDYVYVLDRGRVVAAGTFEHLLAHSPAFQELWQHQEQEAG